MRSVTRALLLAAVAAASSGCGNYSTEDLRFLSALPYRQDLRVVVPAEDEPSPAGLASASALTAPSLACPLIGEADVWKWAKPTSDGLNRGVDWIIGLIDAVREYPPTARRDDYRRWGPFDAEDHPGREIQIVIERTWPAGEDGPPTYGYRFEARVKGDPAFTPLLYGNFTGASASDGSGSVTLDFEAFWTVGMNDAGTPHGSMAIDYDRTSDPVTTQLDLASTPDGGFGVVSFGYGYAGYADKTGAFDYAFRNSDGALLAVETSYDAAGAGRLEVLYTPAGWVAPAGSYRQCWNAAGCLVYVDDPLNLSCEPATQPCSKGFLAACADVPAPPF
jgi:hypothetical protein